MLLAVAAAAGPIHQVDILLFNYFLHALFTPVTGKAVIYCKPVFVLVPLPLQPNLYVHCDGGTSGRSKPNLQSDFEFPSAVNFSKVLPGFHQEHKVVAFDGSQPVHRSKLPLSDPDWQKDL